MTKMQNHVEKVACALRNREAVVSYAGNRPEAILREAMRQDPKLVPSYDQYQYQIHRGKGLLSAPSYMLQFTYDAELPPYDEVVLDDGKWTLSKEWKMHSVRQFYVVSTTNPDGLRRRLEDDFTEMEHVCPAFRQWEAAHATTKLSSYSVVYLRCEYALEPQKLCSMNQIAQQALDRIVSQIFAAGNGFVQHMPDHVRAYFPYSYLQQSISFVDQPLNPKDIAYDAEADLLFGVFCRHKGSAVGLAQAYRALTEKLHLECRLIYGHAGTGDERLPHAWCLVNICGIYHHVDPCFGINADCVCVDGFLKSDREMKPTHQWNSAQAPECPSRIPSYHEVYTFVQNHCDDLLNSGASKDIFDPDHVEW